MQPSGHSINPLLLGSREQPLPQDLLMNEPLSFPQPSDLVYVRVCAAHFILAKLSWYHGFGVSRMYTTSNSIQITLT